MKIKRCSTCGRKPKKVKLFGYYGYFCTHGERSIADDRYLLQLILMSNKKTAIDNWNNGAVTGKGKIESGQIAYLW